MGAGAEVEAWGCTQVKYGGVEVGMSSGTGVRLIFGGSDLDDTGASRIMECLEGARLVAYRGG